MSSTPVVHKEVERVIWRVHADYSLFRDNTIEYGPFYWRRQALAAARAHVRRHPHGEAVLEWRLVTETQAVHRPWFKVLVNTALRLLQPNWLTTRKWVIYSKIVDNQCVGYGFGRVQHLPKPSTSP